MTDTRTDEQIEQDVIDMAVHIWDRRDVFASKFLTRTYCTSCEPYHQIKTWCLPCVATLESLCAHCWIKSRVAEMIEMRDAYNRAHEEEQKMFKDLGESAARQLTNTPPASWRKPKLDVADFASIK